MTVNELIESLKSYSKIEVPVFGCAVQDAVFLNICGAGASGNKVALYMLHNLTRRQERQNTKTLSRSLHSFLPEHADSTKAEETKVYLSLEINNFDYSTTISYYESSGVEGRNGNFLILAEYEEIELRRVVPPHPYLLQMQREDPSNPVWFPFRFGIDEA